MTSKIRYKIALIYGYFPISRTLNCPCQIMHVTGNFNLNTMETFRFLLYHFSPTLKHGPSSVEKTSSGKAKSHSRATAPLALLAIPLLLVQCTRNPVLILVLSAKISSTSLLDRACSCLMSEFLSFVANFHRTFINRR